MDLWNIFTKRRKHSAKQTRRLALEPLEDRFQMAVTLELAGSVLYITGDGQNDTVSVYEKASQSYSDVADGLQVYWRDDRGQSSSQTYNTASLTKVVFRGNGGNDTFKNVTNPDGLPLFKIPSPQKSTTLSKVVPTRTLQSILPVIEAYGGPGNDELWGGPNNDWLQGDGGNDTLYGGNGRDDLYGGYKPGPLVLPSPSFTFDTLLQVSTWETSYRTSDGVRLTLAATIESSYDGTDTLYGGNGADNLYGGTEADTLFGGRGADTLHGGPGSDRLDGGPDSDTLYGGSGDDRYDFNNNSFASVYLGSDTIIESATASGGMDTLNFADLNRAVTVDLAATAQQAVNALLDLTLSSGDVIENVYGTRYDDVIRGNVLANFLDGGHGHDTLYGKAGNDTLVGGPGEDGLIAGWGVDNLLGGTGADRFLVQEADLDAASLNEDTVNDDTAEDATILFKKGHKPGQVERAWTPQEIERVDQVFAMLHKAASDTKLLKLSSGTPLNFIRVVSAGENDPDHEGGNIYFGDYEMNSAWPIWSTGVILHRIGSHWGRESPIWDSFLVLSGWTQTDPHSPAYTRTTMYGESWWHLTDAAFVSSFYDAARSHPVLDFAESFAAYFLQREGLDWYSPVGYGPTHIPEKIALIDSWISSL
jgi:Ca2+-binding RTX toxin-like protein